MSCRAPLCGGCPLQHHPLEQRPAQRALCLETIAPSASKRRDTRTENLLEVYSAHVAREVGDVQHTDARHFRVRGCLLPVVVRNLELQVQVGNSLGGFLVSSRPPPASTRWYRALPASLLPALRATPFGGSAVLPLRRYYVVLDAYRYRGRYHCRRGVLRSDLPGGFAHRGLWPRRRRGHLRHLQKPRGGHL